MTEIVHTSNVMRSLLHLAKRYAPTQATVLIQGESGTGKELLARFIHENSHRSDGPYIRINCSAFNESLVDSALFGHERGAFTGADSQRMGCFEAAGNGTLFLDEIGELPLPLQARLLRALEEKEFHRIGSFKMLPMTARVIAATNRNLDEAVHEGTFREDLFYRLDVLSLHVPPLRDRPDDIPLLAERFLRECCAENKALEGLTLSENACRQLQQCEWPGNARQLRNIIQRTALQCEQVTVHGIDVPNRDAAPAELPQLPPELATLSLKEIERLVIEARLKIHGGNKAEAAETLRVTARTLRNKLAAYSSQPDESATRAA